MTKWNWMCQHREGLKLGKNTDIGAFTYINARYGVEIQEDAKIGSHCSIYSVNTIDGTRGPIVIKKNAKIGAGTVILPNVVVAENSKVGALSLVKEGTIIPPNEVWAGQPAKLIKTIKTRVKR